MSGAIDRGAERYRVRHNPEPGERRLTPGESRRIDPKVNAWRDRSKGKQLTKAEMMVARANAFMANMEAEDAALKAALAAERQ
jgi:hypothetical protein